MAKKIINADQEVLGNLKVTSTPNAQGDFATIDVQGNVRTRTPEETLTDIGGVGPVHIHTFVYEQLVAASVWPIQHDLGKFPSITVVDSANTVVLGQVDYTDTNNVILNFNSAFTGFAYFN